MRVAKLLSTSITATALVLSMLASAFPSAAANGFNGAYFSESSFLSLAPGQSGQFAVGYSNTGTAAWVKGSLTAQTELRTRNGSTALSSAGWAVNWPSASTYANQANDLVAPGQVGFFIYNFQVPAGQATGDVVFSGIPYGGGDLMEDYGYFQIVTVTTSGIKITGSSPASPAITTTPTISGTGATATTLVTVQEGSTSLCTSTASSTGTFSCTVSALSVGSHTLTATAPGQGTSAPFTYVVDTSAPALVSVDTAGGLQRMVVCYNKAMATAGPFAATDERNYETTPAIAGATLTGAGATSISATSTASISTDGKCVLFILTGSSQLPDDTTVTLTVNNVADAAGNKLTAASTISFSTADASSPTATGVTQPGNRTLVVQFSEPILASTVVAANFKWDSANFPGSIQQRNSNPTGGTTTRGAQVRLTLATGGTPITTTSGTHTLDIWNVADLGSNLINPNPTSFTVTIADDTTRPTVTSATAAKSNSGSSAAYGNQAGTGQDAGYIQSVTVNFSEGMQAFTGQSGANAGWAVTNALNNLANYTLFNPDGSAATVGCAANSGTAISANPNGFGLFNSTDARFQLKTVTLYWNVLFGNACNYTLQINNVQDQAGNTVGGGNAVNPNPTLVTVTDSLDTTPFSVVSATASLTQLQVCFNKGLYSSITSVTATPSNTQTARVNGYSNQSASTLANFTSTGTSLGTSLTGATWAGLSDDGLCTRYNFTITNLVSGTYTLTVSNVIDGAANTVTPNPTTLTVSFSDSTAPTLNSSARISSNSFSLTYSKGMMGGAAPSNSAGNPNNYSVNNGTYGNLCAVGTPTLTSNAAGTVWTVTCLATSPAVGYTSDVSAAQSAAGTFPATSTIPVTGRNMADTNGNVISPNPQSRPIV